MESIPRLVGGDVALDLVNTVDRDAAGGDHLRSEADITIWLDRVGIGGRAGLAETHSLRALLTDVFRPLAAGCQPEASALEALRRSEVDALTRAILGVSDLRWGEPLDRVTHSAFELVRAGPLGRLRECDNCSWLFLDLSRNHSRRWCSMEGCGTEVKIRRLTERRQRARRSGANS